MSTNPLRTEWLNAIHLCEIEPNGEEAIQFVKKHENFSLFDSMDDRTLLLTFVGLVVYEKKYQLKYGSTTPASHCYMRLLDRVDKGLLDRDLVFDVGDWSAEYSDNSYIPMDNYRGLGPRAYFAFHEEYKARVADEIERSKEKKRIKIEEGKKKVALAEASHQKRIETLERLKSMSPKEGIDFISKGEFDVFYYYEVIEWWFTNNMLNEQQKGFLLSLFPEKSTKHNMNLKRHLRDIYQKGL